MSHRYYWFSHELPSLLQHQRQKKPSFSTWLTAQHLLPVNPLIDGWKERDFSFLFHLLTPLPSCTRLGYHTNNYRVPDDGGFTASLVTNNTGCLSWRILIRAVVNHLHDKRKTSYLFTVIDRDPEFQAVTIDRRWMIPSMLRVHEKSGGPRRSVISEINSFERSKRLPTSLCHLLKNRSGESQGFQTIYPVQNTNTFLNRGRTDH